MNDLVLEIDGITKSYNHGKPNQIDVLQGCSAQLPRGRVAALVAPSGAGKSTLLHVIGLLDQPDAGRLMLGGAEMTKAGDRKRTEMRRGKLGFVYQFHHLLPEFTAAENIVLPQRAAGVALGDAQTRAAELLEKVGLTGRGHHRPSELSGGEQQRAAFCRALANGPELLLADEPTGNLDPDTAEHVFDMLMRLVRETGLSALIATHNPELAARMDEIWTLRAGQIEIKEN